MVDETELMFAGAIKEIANGTRQTSYMATTEALMRRMAEKGATLEQLTGRKFLNRSRRTLEAHCRRFAISFPDYVPEALRPRDWRKSIRSGGGGLVINLLTSKLAQDLILLACGVSVLAATCYVAGNMPVLG